MYNILGVQIVHALRRLPRHVDEVEQREGRLQHVQVLVQRRALAPLRHDGQRRLRHAAHEQQDVAVPRLAQDCHLKGTSMLSQAEENGLGGYRARNSFM